MPIYMPYTTVQKKLLGITHLNSITVSAAQAGISAAVSDRIASLLRVRHHLSAGEDDDFNIRTMEELSGILTATTTTMTLLLASIAAVSLLVGGIGIMNIMLVSVTERTREVGLRLALGARGRDVLVQFLVEAIVLSLVGGLLGVGLGLGISGGLATFMRWPTAISPGSIAHGVWILGGRRHLLRLLPGTKGGGARSHRRAPIRVEPASDSYSVGVVIRIA